ncbi:MAG TPA: GAF domain-containing protein, partial [Stellaceae bacterium]|nr:GAF domain-containing protein [Stellaceae bacterium]
MRQRSGGGGKGVKRRRGKTLASKARPRVKAPRRHGTSAARGEAEALRLRGELREALDQQAAISEVLQIISGAGGDLQAVLEAVAENSARLCGADKAFVFRFDGELLRVAADYNAGAEFSAWVAQHPIRPGRHSGAARAALERRTVHIPDVRADPNYSYGAREVGAIRTILGVPVLKSGELLGVLMIFRLEVSPFTEKQIALIETFADQVAIAIENARLLGETREALEQQTATAGILQVINASPGDLLPVFDAILEQAHHLCGVPYGSLVAHEGEQLRAVTTRGYSEPLAALMRKPFRPAPNTPHARLLSEKQVIQIPDLTLATDWEPNDPRRISALAQGVRTMLFVPLLKDEELLGYFSANRPEVRLFTDREIALLKSFAAQAVIAMENARLINETREALEQQTATAEVLQVINSSPGNLGPVFEAMLSKAMRLCEAVYGALWIYDGTALHSAATSNLPPALADFVRATHVPGPKSALGRLIATKSIVHIGNYLEDEAYLSGEPMPVATADLGGARALLAVPLLRDTKLMGAIIAYRQEVRSFTDKQIAVLEGFAAQAVIAMENARLINETREALEQQTATAEVLQVINSSPGDLAPVFEAMLEKAMRLCGAAFGGLGTWQGDGFKFVAVRGPQSLADHVAKSEVSLGSREAFSRVARGDGFVHFADIAKSELYRSGDPYTRSLVDVWGGRSTLSVPLAKDNSALGVLAFFRQEVKPFSDKEIALVRNFAAQAVIAMENARLINETREALEQQTATTEVLQVINSSPGNLEPVFHAMLEKATRVCAADAGILCTYDGECFWPVALHGLDEYPRDPIRPHPETGIGRIVRGEDVAHFVDSAGGAAYDAGDPARHAIVRLGARSQLTAALRREGKLLGSFTIWRRELRPFSEKQIALLKSFAAQAVIAMENARLISETREALEQQTATTEVLQVINSSPGNVVPVFEAMLAKATRLCEAGFGALWIYDGERFTAPAVHAVPAAFAEFAKKPITAEDSASLVEILRGNAVVHVPNLTASELYRSG